MIQLLKKCENISEQDIKLQV